MEKKKFLLPSAITAVIAAIAYYIALPPLNIHSDAFWISLIFILLIYGATYWLFNRSVGTFQRKKGIKSGIKSADKGFKVYLILIAVPVVVLIVGHLISSTFFNATRYASVIQVPESVFEEDMPDYEYESVTNIPLMDSESAHILGERTLGSLSEVVSQYRVNGTYSQINYQRSPKKVSALEYGDFFKWLNNRDDGIPGYVMVDPVNNSAEYIKLTQSIRYTESAYFNEDLERKLRFSYPTKIFGNCMFEIDEEGNPYYIVACMAPKVGLFGAMDVSEVIIFNPCDGSSEIYDIEDTPSWVDNVFSGTLASEKFDWYGTLQNGFWNSVVGNKDCKVTTDDFGYIILEDDVWFFTGVTSVSSDESNIGFIISNARTGEYKFYPVIGAEEYSAMGAAQGEVQEKGYVASFPSLINVSGEATYIMVLKDANGLVKLYAFVNVENYSIVATGTTQKSAKEAYIQLLKQENVINGSIEEKPDDQKQATVTVEDIRIITVENQSIVYLTGSDGNLYKQIILLDEALMLVKKGDRLNLTYRETEVNKICQIVSWSFYTEEPVN